MTNCGGSLPACTTDDVVAHLQEVADLVHGFAFAFFIFGIFTLVVLVFVASLYYVRKP